MTSGRMNESRQGSKILSDYHMQQQAQRAKKKLESKPSQVRAPQQIIIKQGVWQQKQREKIIETVKQASKRYPNDLEQQVNFLHFHLQHCIGKRIQILIYRHNCNEGHCLFSYESKFIELQYESNIYLIWKVVLIEDRYNQPI